MNGTSRPTVGPLVAAEVGVGIEIWPGIWIEIGLGFGQGLGLRFTAGR